MLFENIGVNLDEEKNYNKLIISELKTERERIEK